ncbi:MAG: HNH endonuclease [Smithellaceae bacterium]
MTSEDEKQLILLSAVLRLGGQGSKKQVLDEVERANLIKLSPSELEFMKSRREITWRNDLAYVRKHLVAHGYFLDGTWDKWSITDKGKKHFQYLASKALKEEHFRHISPEAIQGLVSLTTKAELSDLSAISGESDFLEGQQKWQWSIRYERDVELRSTAIRIHGTVCMGCGFIFEKIYGAIGAGFIEVHHTKPISLLGGATTVNATTDLVVLCSNCHSIVHRRRPTPLSLQELKIAIDKSKN